VWGRVSEVNYYQEDKKDQGRELWRGWSVKRWSWEGWLGARVVGGIQCQPRPHVGGYPAMVEGQRGLGGVGTMQGEMAGGRGLCSMGQGRKWAVGVVGGCDMVLVAHGK